MLPRPTLLGWKASALFAVLLVAFFVTSYNNLFFLVLAFSAVLGATAMFGGHRNLRAISGAVVRVAAAPAGAERPLSLQVECHGRAFDVEFVLAAAPTTSVAHVPMVVGGESLAGTVPARARGIEAYESIRIVSTFPFGLFRCVRRIPASFELVTYPEPRGEMQSLLRAGDDGDELGVGERRSCMPAGLRAHRPGDELRDVHWRATARRGTPVVREWEPEGGDALDVVVDRRVEAAALERALGEAATVVLAAAAEGRPVTLRSQRVVKLVRGQARGLDEALRWLATAGPCEDGEGPAETADRYARRLRLPTPGE
ncbi:MAG: hypothetical protein RL398_1316 [Planctomycetota bacterium]